MSRLPFLPARSRRLIAITLVLLVLGLGFAALQALTREIHYADVRAAARALSAWQIALALVFTAASYLALTFYDVLALRVIGRPLPWRTAALASFTSYTLSHNLGLSLLTGGSARYRIYTAAGLDGIEVARVVALASATFWAGVVAVAGVALLGHDGPVAIAGLTLDTTQAHLTGGALLVLIAALAAAAGRASAGLSIFGFSLPLPRPALLVGQIGIALIDIACASAALLVLIPGAGPALLPGFILAYALAIVAAVLTHVPGGIGVFEAVLLAMVPGDRASLFAALIAYRLIYYLLPLAVAAVLLASNEGARHRRVGRLLASARTLASSISPLVLSAATFLGGGMLLLSGSLPALHARMGALAGVLPLPFIEASHIAASLVGTGLLLLAPGLYRRLDGAFHATRLLLVAGALFSLAKGIDYEEAFVCIALAGLLQWTRGAFYRRTALTRQPLLAGWLVSVAAVVALATWAGLFAYRHVTYADDLWWRFALDGDAPRFLRATMAIAVALAGALLWRLFSPATATAVEETAAGDVEAVRAILATATRTEAMLALTGDKSFLLSPRRDAFLMYQIKGASWIVMGDPVGPVAAWAELLWALRERADREQGRILLYEASPAMLDLAIGLGLQIIKYGEEAIVDLADFAVDTPRLRSARRAGHGAARAGARLHIVPAAAVPVILDELEAVSNEWIRSKGHREKRFSLGRFDRGYLCNFDIGIVTVEGRIMAFANLWLTEGREEASIDLMRHRDDAPRGTMDFLLVQLMQWAKERGYRRFTLGMAPLAGIDGRRLAPAWAKVAALVFRHGERLYGFRGLRGYKEKFAPRWEPRYVAGPHGLALIQALRDLSRLIDQRAPTQPPRAPRAHRHPSPPQIETREGELVLAAR
ncbi:phosphatidylglycerol lysyltransferase [Sphingomonas naasensis]|uniref:Bifunctional lysylphosphatidylglycerol flippase/synthetase MprF n=1 Tax=Sphingomonas naasensis TaxID=1344951 RepID=A0A4S1WGY7_9SPHN|nr:bifunctional lysylphosphatidylglycerol flippase/synthetase MprF [Sphingomonas naasensis]NIJ21524.1 phosphatidylglycerol lysyltransferase [Sphingomonas naasensis]TGX41525.1 bifunctional lysylphosphatidylglycerol flippase/synthetase MprF [Sphingomonas naasensis]